MITEEMLISAAAEVSDAMVSGISEQPHRFSAGFKQKLRSLTRRAEHPVRYRLMRQAAAVLVAVLTVFSVLYVGSPTVHATVDLWMRSMFGSYFQYSPLDTTPADVEYDYFLPKEFDGYTLMSKLDRGDSVVHIYSNENGQMLSFDYVRGTLDSSLFLMNVENCTQYSGYVGSLSADIYIAPTHNRSSVIVWQDPAENVLFYIQAVADKDQLIAIAEKVEKIPKK